MQHRLATDPFVLVCLPRLVDDRNLRVADFAQFWAIAKVHSYSLFCDICEYFCSSSLDLGVSCNLYM